MHKSKDMTAEDDYPIYGEDDVTIYKQQIYNEYYGKFTCDTTTSFYAYAQTPAEDLSIVDDSNHVLMLVLCILDNALECEDDYPNTFWLECMRVFCYGKWLMELQKCDNRIIS